MRLLEIKAIIDWDKDVKEATFQTQVLEERDDAVTSYAILSHRWQDGHEVDYNEMTNLMKMDEEERKKVKQRNGYKKILASCEQAMRDGFEWLWVDTCCIDKRSSSELSEAINSMYRWYENSTKCYAYLHDVDSTTFPTKQNSGRFSKCKGWPEWFSRGWTLQELIAPRVVQFFNKEWAPIGNKRDLADTLEKITCISKNILISGMDSGVRSAAQIMSWAADRETTRAEDRAYSLLGLFGVHMPMMYGEGKGAFQRLQLEIIRLYNDHSLFAWDPEGRMRRCGSILADDPSYFRDCDGIWSMEPKWFVSQLKSHMRDRSAGVVGKVMPANLMNFTFLTVRGHALIKELSTCSVGSGGLQISLPIAPYPSSNSSPPLFRATLACVASLAGPLMTIDLVSDSTRYYRFFGATGELTTFPRVKQVFLSYCQGELRSRRTLILDDGTVSFYGFTRCGTFPSGIVGNSVKLSGMNDLIVVIYANDKADVRFAVGFGYYLGNPWTHVIYDESRLTPWKDYAKKAYGSLSTSQADLARNTSDYDVTTSDTASFIKHAHLPRSIWAARTTWGVWNRGNCTVIIDIVVCTGCCRGPLALKTSTADWSGVENPGFMQQALSTPRVWCRDAIDDKRRTQFKEIRERFYTLLNWSRPATSAGNSRSPNSKVARKETIKYFSAMFGIEHFENYVGKITFFKTLSTSLELKLEPPRVMQDPSINALVKTLRKRMGHGIPRRRMQGVQNEVTAISNTLGIKLLEEMATIYTRFYDILCPLKVKLDRSCMEYDMSKPIAEFISSFPPQTTTSRDDSIHDMVQEIKRLQTTLDTTENIDEQYALEEDITGRILWTCHSGFRSAVGHIPAKVLHNILENDKMCNLVDRVKFLEEISRVFNGALDKLATDNQAHLRRIMADAEAGTSKYQLLLDERAREQRVPGAMREEQTRT